MKNDEKIGFRELLALTIVVIGIKAIDETPLSLFKAGKNATWMIPILWMFILILPQFLLLKLLKHYQSKCLAEVIHTVLGKYFGFIINFLLFLLILVATALNARSYVDVISISYQRTPVIVLLLSLLLVSGYTAYRGPNTIVRTCYIIIPLFFFGIILSNIILIDDYIPDYLFPLFGPGIGSLVKNSLFSFTYVVEYLYIGLIFKKAKDYKTYRNAIVVGLFIALLYISMTLANYVLVFDYIAPQKHAHIFGTLSHMTRVGVFINNLDAIYFALWISASILRFSFYIYITSILFGYLFKIKEEDHRHFIIPICTLTLVLGLIPKNLIETQIIYRDQFEIKDTWPLTLFLPIILFIVAFLKGEFKHESNPLPAPD